MSLSLGHQLFCNLQCSRAEGGHGDLVLRLVEGGRMAREGEVVARARGLALEAVGRDLHLVVGGHVLSYHQVTPNTSAPCTLRVSALHSALLVDVFL